MLHLFLGGLDRDSMYQGYVSSPSDTFDLLFEPNWMDNEFCRSVIKDIDNSEFLKDQIVDSPVLGYISIRDISSGAKNLILAYNHPEYAANGERLGDNCWAKMIELGKLKDVTFCINHMPIHSNNIPDEWNFVLDNTGKLYNTDWSGFTEIFFAVDYETNHWAYEAQESNLSAKPPTVSEFYGIKPTINSPAANYKEEEQKDIDWDSIN